MVFCLQGTLATSALLKYSGAKSRCKQDHIKPNIHDCSNEHNIRKIGNNDLNSEKTSSKIAKSLIDLARSIKTDSNNVTISLIAPRDDNLNNKANEVNN